MAGDSLVRVLDFESVRNPGSSPTLSTSWSRVFKNPLVTLINGELVCLPLAGIFNHVMFHLQYLFQLFEWHAYKLAGLSLGSAEDFPVLKGQTFQSFKQCTLNAREVDFDSRNKNPRVQCQYLASREMWRIWKKHKTT